MSLTIAAAPDRLKWCSHYANKWGFPQGRCKLCPRYFARSQYTARYRSAPAFAEAERLKSRLRHQARA